MREPSNPKYVAREIEKLIEDNQIDLATKKLMDFATNFGGYRSRRSEALDIRRSFNQWRENNRLYQGSQDVKEDLTRLVQRMVDFIDQIREDNPDSSPQGITNNVEEEENEASTSKQDLPLPNFPTVTPPSSTINLPPRTSTSENPNNEDDQSTDEEQSRDSWREKKKKFIEEQKKRKQLEIEQDYYKTVFLGNNIKKQYKGKSTNFTLFINELRLKYGEITSLVGENGNGKTTLLRIVAARLQETSGEIEYPALAGKKKPKTRDFNRIKQQIAYIPQDLPKWNGTLIDNLHFSAAIHDVKGEENEFEVDFVISRLGLDKYRDLTWNEISGGFKMRFALAKALLWNPKILVLDEPLANLDVNTQMLFLEDLRDIADSTEHPKSVILSSQHLHEVESITDNLLFVKDGSALYNGRLQDFGENRADNSFEFVCNLSKSELMDVIEDIDYTRIDIVIHFHYIVTTSRTVTSRALLKLFSEKNIEVSFFRDISKSTRRLFSDHSNK